MGRTAITVYPQAQLTLKYFFQRDVFGPDPSDPSAPSEPFSLGVIVSNTGKGIAQNVSITSAQPQIVDNAKGLLVNFTTLGTEINGQTLSPGLTADFGNIDPGQTAVGRWLFTSSLEGYFKNFQASFEHTDALGGQQLSLIQSVEIHELIHVVHMTPSGLPDFLVDDQPSSLHLPDTLYFGNGSIAPVTATGLGSVDAPASFSHLQVHLTATLAAGYGYLQIADPGNGNFHLVRVVRSDATEIAVDDNVWETDRIFPDGGVLPIKENLLHLLDFHSTGSYTLYYAPNDPSPPQVAAIAAVAPNPRSTAVSSIDVTFTKPIDPAAFDYRALTLTRNGGANLITSAVTVTFVSGSTYRINGLADLTRAKGTYLLTINLAGIQGLYGNTAAGVTTATWSNLLSAGALLVPMIEGTTFIGTVATLADGDALSQAGDYTVLIAWGDGTTTTGTVQAAAPDNFNLLGSHRYAEEGSYPVTVTVTDKAGNTATAGSAAAVNDATLTATPVAVAAPEGIAFSGSAATFTDAGGNEPEANYSTIIAWGDGATSAGTVHLAGNVFTVMGGHTYAEEGTYSVTVTIQEEGGAGATATPRATVADADLHASAVDQTAMENQALTNVVVASFTDDDPAGTVADSTATIDWGDGTAATSGTISFNSQTQRFEVRASHTYLDDGTFTITVSPRDMGGANITATSMAHISDPAVMGTGGFTMTAVEGADSGLQTVATFTDPGGAEALADYTAMIDWGDGTAATTGTISYDAGSQTFTVQDSHAYAEEGSYVVTVTLQHDTAPDATATSTATIADAPLHARGRNVQAVEGAAVQRAVVAVFTDDDPNATASLFSAMVDWGDGSAGPAKVRANKHGSFDVVGGHTYLTAGTYTITVDITDAGGSTTEVTSTATVVSGGPNRALPGLGTETLGRGNRAEDPTILAAADWDLATEAHRHRLTDALFSSEDWLS